MRDREGRGSPRADDATNDVAIEIPAANDSEECGSIEDDGAVARTGAGMVSTTAVTTPPASSVSAVVFHP
jgi:hypothetical protein